MGIQMNWMKTGQFKRWSPKAGDFIEGVYLGFREIGSWNRFCVRDRDDGQVWYDDFEDVVELAGKLRSVNPGERVRLTFLGAGEEQFSLEVFS